MELLGFTANHVSMAKKRAIWRLTKLRQWREYRGKTLEEIAPQMGITYNQLSKIERGLHPYMQRVIEVAAIEYDCSPEDILNRVPNPAKDGPPKPLRRRA